MANLNIQEELLSFHAINPFIAHSSSPRGLMMSSHIAQHVVLEEGRPGIIQTGIERQLGKNTYSAKAESDVRVVSVIKRYNGVSANTVTATSEYTVIVQDIETGVLDIIPVPSYHKFHQLFGFGYRVNEDILNPSIIGRVLPKDTVLADSPAVHKDGSYAFGRPVNIAYMSIPEVTGDGVVISDTLAKKLRFKTYETVVVEFGEKCFPLNLYGDESNYKAFPEIGEYIRKDRAVIATRNYDTELSPALTSVNDVMQYDPDYDRCYFSKSVGGKIIDIKAYSNPKIRRNIYTNTSDQVVKYTESLKNYYRDILKVYEQQKAEYWNRFKLELPVSERLTSLLLDARAITEEKKNVKYTYKNDLVDLYRVEFVIEHDTVPDDNGFKITGMNGSKGIIAAVMPEKEMPVDVYGNIAEVVMDPTSIPG